MDQHSENAAPAKGGEFGIHQKAWQLLNEYQTQDAGAIETSIAPWQSVSELSLQVIVKLFIARHRLHSAVGKVMFEHAGLGRRAL